MGKTFDISKIKVAVGLSGGVDSSVTALLLKEAGFDVTGVYLKCYWTHEGCTADKDRASAARVASFLNIPFEVWDFEKEYKEKVIDYFYAEYEKGRTPNPDVACNREIKFGLFFEKAVKDRGFNFIATGHYAGTGMLTQKTKSEEQLDIVTPFSYQKIEEGDKKGIKLVVEPKYFRILKQAGKKGAHLDTYYSGLSIFGGVDKSKDQSYFLYDIEKNAVEHSLYPLFGLLKSQVRQIAVANNLPTANRPDSQGICFIGEVNIEKFLKERIKEHPGEVVDIAGNVIGSHKGIEFYTIGQRHGFRVDSRVSAETAAVDVGKETNITAKPRSGCGLPLSASYPANHYKGPLYVIGKDVGRNRLIVGAGEECKTDRFEVKIGRNDQFPITNFQTNPNGSMTNDKSLFVRIRHLGELIPCRVVGLDSRVSAETAAVASGKDTSRPAKPRSGCGLSLSASYPVNQFLDVKLEYPVFGVAPGQSAVFYVARVVGAASASRLTQGVPPRLRSGSSSTFAVTHDSAPAVLQADVWEVVGGGVIEETGD